MQIADHVFLVSGGGSGLGAATARMLIDNGASVVITDVNAVAGEQYAAELGAKALFVQADVTDEGGVDAAVNAATRHFGGLHGAICCAGIGPAERVVGRNGPHGLASFTRVVQVNLVGTFNVVRLAANAIQQNAPGADGERGVLVMTASVAAFDGQIGQAAYSASKGGIVGMTLPVARELARFGIRVMTIAPGIFETPLLGAMPQDVRDSLGKQVPFPSRLGQPVEYAALVGHIIENRMLNGEVIRLDGAIRMAAK